LLEDRVLAVPQRQREAEQLLVVGDPREPVLAPAVGTRAGLVVGEVIPRVARVAVVLAHRPPLPLRKIRPPLFPLRGLGAGLLESTMLGVHLWPPVRVHGVAFVHLVSLMTSAQLRSEEHTSELQSP